ncbi:MAG: twin-arginine translocation signal domain-containing protein [Nitrospira sp.]|nr:twin-arginine translocation signal domain-containing protein [bacterium]MBL7048744.1 twin-arginine translocation signal domain-containing protein [Nitrospira sp.]
MERRTFLKGIATTAALLTANKAEAVFSGVPSGAYRESYKSLTNHGNPSGMEKKHVPGIKSPLSIKAEEWFEVTVNVGFMSEHPTTSKHWITMILLLSDGVEIARTEYKAGGTTASSATFKIKLEKSATIEAIEDCNLHGTWISEPVKITVS